MSQTAAGSDGEAARILKASQRPTHSCTECSRRKTKCDKVRPACGQCLRRGKTHLCKVEPHVSHKERKQSEPILQASVDSSALTSQTNARHVVFGELAAFRSTVDTLRARIGSLEGSLANAFASYNDDDVYHDDPEEAHDTNSTLQQNGTNASTSSEHSSYNPYPTSGYPSSRRLNNDQKNETGVSNLPIKINDHDHDHHFENSQLREEEVNASVALEFLSLGRTHNSNGRDLGADQVESNDYRQKEKNFDGLQDTTTLSSPIQTFNGGGNDVQEEKGVSYPSPMFLFPTLESIREVIPNRRQAEAIINHSLDWLGWHHGCVHAPSFRSEVAEFWEWDEDRRLERCNSAWLGLYFAILVVGVSNLTPVQAIALDLAEDETASLAKTWFDCSLASIYRFNFLQNHSLFAVQTIAVLSGTAQDAASPNVIPTLLTTGISIAQDLGMHRMTTDANWEHQTKNCPHEVQVKSLIHREVCKRTFWALTTQDWFGIPYRKTYVVQPAQVTTPLPIHCRDEDLLTGRIIHRSLEEYTITSKLLLWIRIARCLQSVFEHLDMNVNPSYKFLLSADAKLQDILRNAPEYLRSERPAEKLPPCVDWVRSTFRISTNHKVLTLHRPFLHRAFQDNRYEFSRQRAITASRTILREAPNCGTIRLWTIPYHIAAAACVVLLDLFQQKAKGVSSSSTAQKERREVIEALEVLEAMQGTSSIARRGFTLVSSLVEEESRLRKDETGQFSRPPPTPSSSKNATSFNKKRTGDHLDVDQTFSAVAKKVTLSGQSPSNSNSTLDSPYKGLHSPSTLIANGSHHRITPASEHSQEITAQVPLLAPSPSSILYPFDPSGNADIEYGMGGATPTSDSLNGEGKEGLYGTDHLPQEFISLYLQSGLDLGLGLENLYLPTASSATSFKEDDFFQDPTNTLSFANQLVDLESSLQPPLPALPREYGIAGIGAWAV